jgi:hypothetical protein
VDLHVLQYMTQVVRRLEYDGVRTTVVDHTFRIWYDEWVHLGKALRHTSLSSAKWEAKLVSVFLCQYIRQAASFEIKISCL